MKSRKKFFRKLFIAAALMAIIGAIYAHFGILPGKARPYVIEKIEKLTHKKVNFDKALYIPFHGFVFYHLQVAEQNGAPLFSAKKYALDIKIIPFLRDKKIIVRNIFLETPVYDLTLEPRKPATPEKEIKTEISGEINVPVVQDTRKMKLEDISSGPDVFLPENVYVEQIQISDGLVTIRKDLGGPVTETLKKINVRVVFQKSSQLYLEGSLKLGQTPYAAIDLQGYWNLKKTDYQFNLSTAWDQIPPWLADYQKTNFLVLREGRVKLVTELRSVGEEQALFHAKADLEGARLTVGAGQYNGRMRVNAKGLFDFTAKKVTRYKGSLELKDIDILNLSANIPKIDHVSGNLDFQPDTLTIQSINGKYKDIPFDAEGTIRSFSDPLIDGQIHTSISLEKIMALVPAEQKKLLANFNVTGNCEALTSVRGPLKRASEISTEYKLALSGASITSHDGKIKLSGVHCDLSSGKDGLRVSKARFEMNKKNYRADLFVPKNPALAGSLNLSSSEISLKTDYRMSEGLIVVENARAGLAGITAAFQGQVHLLEKPVLDIHGKMTVSLEKVSSPYSAKNSWLKTASPSGTLEGQFQFRGVWTQWLRSRISIDAKSQAIRIYKNILLEHVALRATLKDGVLNVDPINAEAYGGMFGLKGSFDLNSPQIPFDANLYLNSLDIHRVAITLPMENKKLAGRLTAQGSVRGLLTKQDSFKGHGSISVKDGFLWETSQFKAMGNLPLVRVEGLDSVIFRQLVASYEIRAKKFWTEDMSLISDTVYLDLQGSVGFDQTLDLLMDIQYTNAVFLGAEDAGGLVPLVVNQAAGLISQYKISGTMKKPSYGKAGAPVVDSLGKKIGGLITSLT